MYEYSENEFIKLNRKILDWRWFSDPVTRDLFIYCLLKANWKDGTWHGIEYKRGEFITSLPSLSSDLGFSIQNIRTALAHLKSTGELTDRITNKNRIITVVNYDKYQSANKQDNSQLTGNQQATNRQLTADIRSKEDKNNIIKRESKRERPKIVDMKPETQRPSLDDVKEEHTKQGYTFDLETFYNKLSAVGWNNNGQPVHDYKALMKVWQQREDEYNRTNQKRTSPDGSPASYDLSEFEKKSVGLKYRKTASE